jgi:WD40 repeat protein
VAFTADGQTLVATTADATVHLWDSTGWQTASFEAEGNTAAFDHDGTTLATAGAGRAVILWDTRATTPPASALLDSLCAMAGRDLTRAEWAEFVPDHDYAEVCP